MSVLGWLRPMTITEVPENHFVVVHPLDDVPEQKVNTSDLGAMPMITSVKLSLMALRGYLILMMFLVLYHVLDLAGAFGRHAR
ncbi:MAG TPA: hypothetical protein VFL34_16290 [Candidatus Sulfotelmatobacter sp.]|nr:hypothetical protein [Candidatus Sulfotelmatobacter sp.]